MRSTTGIGVQKVISHEGFDPVTNDNDVALLKLQTPLTFSGEHPQNVQAHLQNVEVALQLTLLWFRLPVADKVSPVCLPNAGVDLSPPHQAWITGWGALRSEGTYMLDSPTARLPKLNSASDVARRLHLT